MRARYSALAVTFTIGCASGPRFRNDIIATGQLTANIGAANRQQAQIQIDRTEEAHRLYAQLQLPRAMELTAQLSCPEAQWMESTKTVGESFEKYRVRRIAELERERTQYARAIGGTVGIVAPRIAAQGTVTTPNASASGEVVVNPGELATVAVMQSEAIELPPGDVGAQRVVVEFSLNPERAIDPTGAQEIRKAPILCTVTLAPVIETESIAGLHTEFRVERITDLARERKIAWQGEVARGEQAAPAVRAKLVAKLSATGVVGRTAVTRNQMALNLRLRLHEKLILAGADPNYRARIRQADEERRIAAQIKLQSSAAWKRREAAVQEKARAHQVSMRTRLKLWGFLQGIGADPTLRTRLAYERQLLDEKQRQIHLQLEQERQARITAEIEANARAQAEAVAISAAAEIEAISARRRLASLLTISGAILRPPRPVRPVEQKPAMPWPNALWIAGSFEWTATGWLWRPGYYVPKRMDNVANGVRVEMSGVIPNVRGGITIEVGR